METRLVKKLYFMFFILCFFSCGSMKTKYIENSYVQIPLEEDFFTIKYKKKFELVNFSNEKFESIYLESYSLDYNGNFSFSAGIGVVSYGNYQGFGNQGAQIRHSLMATYDDGKTGFSLGTNFWSGDGGMKMFDQQTGIVKGRSGDFNFSYENDGTPFQKKWFAGGILGDGGDSHRTALVTIGIGELSIKMNLFTGKRSYDGDPEHGKWNRSDFVDQYGAAHPYNGNDRSGHYVNEIGTKYRFGGLSFSYKGYNLGANSQRISHFVQGTIHRWTKQGTFQITDWNVYPYFQYQTTNQFTSW